MSWKSGERKNFEKRSTVSTVPEMTLINNRLWRMMIMWWKKKPFELAIKMSLVTFKGQVLMKQSGQKAEYWCCGGSVWGGNGCIASSSPVICHRLLCLLVAGMRQPLSPGALWP